MQLHQIQVVHKLRDKKPRVGRGGKRGTFSGRGTKGQKARAGHRIRPGGRDLIQRLPKLRGFKNLPASLKPTILNLGDLENLTSNVINPKVLKDAGVIKSLRQTVKILSQGELKKPLTIQNIKLSKKAEEKVKAVGGKIE